MMKLSKHGKLLVLTDKVHVYLGIFKL
jgi:hypothetical protein